jgi:hypothetical protein
MRTSAIQSHGPASILIRIALLSALAAFSIRADESSAGVEQPDSAALALTVDPERIAADGLQEPGRLKFDLKSDHYDSHGYPESSDGSLVLELMPYGPAVPLRDKRLPPLLYAQFSNRQRDAVYLTREGAFSDTLPDGSLFEIPHGFGALKTNSVLISLVEGETVPHVSDNRKEYELFPLEDLYLGGSFGLTGLLAELRYVYSERYVVKISFGANLLGPLYGERVFGFHRVTALYGAGFRTPGPFPEILGKSALTFGFDMLSGFGDRDLDPGTPSFFWLPGLTAEFEKTFYRGSAAREDFRTDPRPYNYGVNSVYLRLGAYLNTADLSRSKPILLDLRIGASVSVSGPRIPPHEFKETRPVYLSREYLDELERQRERIAARERALLEAGSSIGENR